MRLERTRETRTCRSQYVSHVSASVAVIPFPLTVPLNIRSMGPKLMFSAATRPMICSEWLSQARNTVKR